MGNNLAALMKRARRRTIDPQTGKTYTQERLGEVLGVSRETIKAIELGDTLSVSPAVAEKMEAALKIDIVFTVAAMGYDLGFDGIEGENEVALLKALRRKPEMRPGVEAMLGLPGDWQTVVGAEQLQAEAAKDLSDRQEIQG